MLCVALVATGCGTGTAPSGDSQPPAAITVFAAASLTEAFTEIGRQFERRDEGVRVDFNFGPSDGLAAQLEQGSPVDVFASASPAWMDHVARRGPGVIGRRTFARGELVVIVPAANPAGIDSLRDVAEPGVQLVLGAEGVPAGEYARRVLRNAGIEETALANVVSNAEDVKAVVNLIVLGEADAGIVYRTDVTEDLASRVGVVDIPAEMNVVASYPIAVMADSKSPALAGRFVDYVLNEGQRTLSAFGFHPAA